MANRYFVTVTTVGENKIAQAIALDASVDMHTIVVGDGLGKETVPDENQTCLLRETWRGTISRLYINPDDPTGIIVEAVVPSEVGGFTVREVGVLDADGDLIMVGNYPPTFKPISATGADKSITIKLSLKFTNTDSSNVIKEYVNGGGSGGGTGGTGGGGLGDIVPTPEWDTLLSNETETGFVNGSAYIYVKWKNPPIANFDTYILEYRQSADRSFKAEFTTENVYKITLLEANTTYELRVLAKDKYNNTSAWSTSKYVLTQRDTIPPLAPSGLKVTPGYSTIIVEWARNFETDLDIYEVYYGTSADFVPDTVNFTNRKSAGNVTTVSIPVDRAVSNHYVKVCALDKSGNRSLFSSAGATTNLDPLTPTGMSDSSLTTGMTTDMQGNTTAWIILNWTDGVARDGDFAYYEYSIRQAGGNSLTFSGTKESSYTFTPVLVGQDYYVKIRAVGALGAISAWSYEIHIQAAVDTEAPPPPTNIKLSGGIGVILLSWDNPNTKDFDHIHILRNLVNDQSTAVRVGDRVIGSSWFDTTVEDGTTYYYWLRSADWSDNESVNSNVVFGTTSSILDGITDLIAPDMPTNVTATTGIEYGYNGAASMWIKIDWDACTATDFNYYEYRIKEAGGLFRTYRLTDPTDTIRNVLPDTTYIINVRAIDTNQNVSPWSYPDTTIVSAKDTTIPKPPTGLSAAGILKNIIVSWINPIKNTDETDLVDLKSVEVWRSDTNDRLEAVLLSSVNGESFIDPVGAYDVTKYYWVRSVDSSGNPGHAPGFLSDSNWYPLSSTNGVSCTTQSLMAGDVTAAPSGYDMSVNADFDQDLQGWVAGDVGVLPTLVDVTDGRSGQKAVQSPIGESASIKTATKIPIDIDRGYIVEAYIKMSSGIPNGTALLTIKLLDEQSASIIGDSSTYWFKVYEGTPTSNFTLVRGVFGVGTQKPFPAGARFIEIELDMIASGTQAQFEAQGIRLREIIEGAYIGNAAIKSANIADAQILDAHIVSLTGDKIQTGIIQSYDGGSQLNLTSGEFSLKDTFVWDGQTLLIGSATGSKIYWNGTKLVIDGDLEIGTSSPVATKDDIAYKIEIISSGGMFLRKTDNPNEVLTTLTAIVSKGPVDVTDSIPANQFKWIRSSPPPYDIYDAAWNAAHAGGYKTINVTSSDVFVRSVFTCSVE